MVDEAPSAAAPSRPRNPAFREPAFNVPGIIVACCVVLLAIHGLRAWVSNETDNTLVAQLAFIPARITLALGLVPHGLSIAYHEIVDRSPVMASQLAFLMGDGQAKPWTVLTYALLHGSWPHVGFNCIWLVAFGSAVARRFSTAAFLLLLACGAVCGAFAQWLADVTSFQLIIGASAAVSGVMGAAVRFVFRPDEEPRQIFDRHLLNETYRLPALSLRETMTNRAAVTFLIFWFVTNFVFGIFPSLSGIGDAPVAWQAHIGGFLLGLLAFPLFDREPDASPIEREDTADLGPPASPPPI